MLTFHERRPSGANAVLAGGGAAHTERQLVDRVRDEQYAAHFVRVTAVDQVAGVETAAADMAVGGDGDTILRANVLDRPQGRGDALHRHAEVLAAVGAAGAGTQHADGGADHRPRLPKGRDSFRLVGPFGAEGQRRYARNDLLGVPAYAGRVAIYFKEDQRCDFGQIHPRPVDVHGLDTALVQDLDRRRADSGLEDRLHSQARALQHVEQGNHDGTRGRDRHQLQPQTDDNAQRSL